MTQLYMLTAPSGKRYIGVTKGPLSRHLKEHSYAKRLIGHAVRKYGGQIKAETLVVGAEDYIYDLEKKAIEVFDTLVPCGYNLRDGGIGGGGLVPSQETRQKMSEAHKHLHATGHERMPTMAGKMHSLKTRQHMSEARRQPNVALLMSGVS